MLISACFSRSRKSGGRAWFAFFSVLVVALLFGCSAGYSEKPASSFESVQVEEVDGDKTSFSPQASYSPEEVVRLQMDALQENNKPYENAGIEQVFRFSAPANTRQTGPLARFVRMLNSPVYRALVDHQGARYGEIQRRDDLVLLPVTVRSRYEPVLVTYLFILQKQTEAPYEDMWMIVSVSVGAREGVIQA